MARGDDFILVTGATGSIGRRVVDELVRADAKVRALTRRPASAVLPPGVEVVGGDFTAPASLDEALDGAGTVFLVWTASTVTAPDVIARLASHASLHPRRVVYLSAPFRTPHPFFQQPNPMRDMHAEVERLLAESGLETTILRPGMFASNALHWWAPQIRAGNVVRWPYGDAETAPIDERDIAAVAARVLLDAQQESWTTHGDHVLTGPESLSQIAQVHAIGKAIGRPLAFQELSPDEFRSDTRDTWPPAAVEMLLGAWRATLGHRAFVTSAAEEILGAPARSFSLWAEDHAAAFTGG